MKKNLLLIIFVGIFGFAQAQSEAYSKDISMSLGNKPAIVLDMNDIDAETALDYWKDYMRSHCKLKRNKKANEYYVNKAKIPTISSKKINIISKIEDLNKSSRLYFWIDTGTAFLDESTDATMYANAKQYINDFAIEAEKTHVENMLKKAKKEMKSLEREMKSLKKDKENHEEDIEDAKKKIKKLENKIVENEAAQKKQVEALDLQKELINKIQKRLESVGKTQTKM